MDNARLYEEAVHAARAREQVVSHDLRNLANTLVVSLQLARRRWRPTRCAPSRRSIAPRRRCLVGNAIKLTPAGGAISLTVTPRDGEVELGVEDSGAEIPEVDRDRVFDRFYRGSRPTGQGAGPGLAVARGLVEAQGGRIGVTTASSGGARFYFMLPRTAPAVPRS